MYAVNMTTGKEEWNIDGFYGEAHAGGHAMADGYLAAHNMYDNEIYIIGKGRSATTISAPTVVQQVGSKIPYRAQSQINLLAKQAQEYLQRDTRNSDDSMSQWTSYLHAKGKAFKRN